MKILYHHRIASKDGQFVHLDAIFTELRAAQHDVLLVGPRIVEQGQFGGDGGLLSRVRAVVPGWIGEILELAYNAIAFPRLLIAAVRFRPRFIYERYNLFSLAGVWVSGLLGCPLILEVNAPLASERSKYGGLFFQGFAKFCERFVWRRADAVLPVTGVLAEHVLAAGANPERIVVIANGCDRRILRERETGLDTQSLPFPDDAVILGFCGFLRDWHGLENVLDVISEPDHAQTCFLVVGDGPARESLERRAMELNVSDRLLISGTVAHSEVASFVSGFDIALQPDVVDYASPLKLFDYIAAGCAIIAPDKPNIREILTHGDTSFLFESGDLEAFQRAVEDLLDDPVSAERIGRAARENAIVRDLTWMANAGRIVRVAENLFAGRVPGAGDVSTLQSEPSRDNDA